MISFRQHGLSGLRATCALVALIWCVQAVNTVLGLSLNDYGIYPRAFWSLPGVITWPFLHGGPYHLMMNTGPLLVMGFLVALRGVSQFVLTTMLIVVVGGLGVWLFGRQAYHIGASGLVFGYFGFLVTVGLVERSIPGLLISSLVLFYYGGMIVGIIPTNGFVSWEGHLFGMLAGVLAARLLAFKPKESS